MLATDIERIKATHRPRLYWLGCAVVVGCTCGAGSHPCVVLAHAQLVELLVRRNPNRVAYRDSE